MQSWQLYPKRRVGVAVVKCGSTKQQFWEAEHKCIVSTLQLLGKIRFCRDKTWGVEPFEPRLCLASVVLKTERLKPGSEVCSWTFPPPTQWLTVVRLSRWKTRSSCPSQSPRTVALPGLAVRKALCGRRETTALCVERTDRGASPAWSVKVKRLLLYSETTQINVCFFSHFNTLLKLLCRNPMQ